MQDKRVTIRIPFDIWKTLRELQIMGKISSIQQAAVTGINKLIEALKRDEEEMRGNSRAAAKKRVLDALLDGKPLGNWEDIHRERTQADADRAPPYPCFRSFFDSRRNAEIRNRAGFWLL